MLRPLLALLAAASFEPALPSYPFAFPRDHASHPGYQTEWWYYTGHLADAHGRRFGFELTFFRFGHDPHAPLGPAASRWRYRDLYAAHFAVTEEASGRFRYASRLDRGGLGLADAARDRYAVRNATWHAELRPDGRHHLYARDGGLGVDLALAPRKPPVLHGDRGFVRKADGEGHAAEYCSLTRLATTGSLTVDGERLAVTGDSWMDHEFGTRQLGPKIAGWDWFSLQLDDGRDLMLYRFRRPDGASEPTTFGTLVGPDGAARHLPASAFALTSGRSWTSPRSGGRYPMGWHVAVPGEGLSLDVAPVADDQELRIGGGAAITYWEGAARVTGTRTGLGYVELTGYAPGSRPDI